MKLVMLFGLAGMLFLNVNSLFAQTVNQPGQVGASLQLRPGTNLDPYSLSAVPKTTVASVDDSHNHFVNRLWISSLVAAAAATSLDAATSWGQLEGNGLLASSNGRFGAKGLAIKAGFASAMIVPQICLRKHKELKTAFTIGNFTEAAIFTGVSVHNVQVRNASGQ